MTRAAELAHRALNELAKAGTLEERLRHARAMLVALDDENLGKLSPELQALFKDVLQGEGAREDQSRLMVSVVYSLIHASGELDGRRHNESEQA